MSRHEREVQELKERIAALEAEAQDVKRVEAWLRENYGRRIGAEDALPDALFWVSDRGVIQREADSLAALGRMLKEGE